MSFFRELYTFRSTLILIFTPILLLPLIVFSPPGLNDELACAYTILLMAIYWVTEVVPLAVTALLPLVLYPFLGVLPAKVVSVQYLKDVNILFLGGLTVAVAVEHWNLHKRIALKVLTFVGAKPRWLLFGFMITTAFLSMWISNVATTAMMIPIAQAVLTELTTDVQADKEDDSSRDSGRSTPDDLTPPDQTNQEVSKEVVYLSEPNPLIAEMGNIGQARKLGNQLHTNSLSHELKPLSRGDYAPVSQSGYYEQNEQMANIDGVEVIVKEGNNSPTSERGPDCSSANLLPEDEFSKRIDREKRHRGLSKALTICVCYSANIGGTATLTGTGPNLIMAGQFKTTYPEAPVIDFGSWVFFALPGMVLFLLFTWFWLQFLFLDINWAEIAPCFFKKRRNQTTDEMHAEAVIKRQYNDLGPMSFAEKSVLALFVSLALLWLTRDPGFVNGWGSLSIFKSRYVTDASVAMLITFILFVFPSKRPNFFCCRGRGDISESGPVPALLTWNVVQHKMAWNVILLLGGSFAMALGSKQSGLSAWIGSQMEPLNAIPPVGANFICCLIICVLTQCTSNTATATVFLPILAELAEILGVNPLYLMLPSTLVTSYAFMLPVSTPPNAIAYSYGHLQMGDMIRAGFVLNIVGITIAMFSVHVFGGLAFDVFESCPSWLVSEHCPVQLVENATSLFLNSTSS